VTSVNTPARNITRPRCKLNSILSPRNRVLLEKLNGSQLVKKFSTFFGTRRFITAFTSSRHLSISWASSIQYIPPHPTSRRYILILSSLIHLGLPSGLFPSGFPTKTLYAPLLSPTRGTCPAYLTLLDLRCQLNTLRNYVIMPRSDGNCLEWVHTARLSAASVRIIGDLYSSYLWNKIIHQNQHLQIIHQNHISIPLVTRNERHCFIILHLAFVSTFKAETAETFGLVSQKAVKEFFIFENEIVRWLTDCLLSWYNHKEVSSCSGVAAAGGTSIGLLVFVAGKLAFWILIATDCWGFEIYGGPVDADLLSCYVIALRRGNWWM